MTTVHACIQQIPDEDADPRDPLETREIEGTGDTYLEAVAAAEAAVPDGWRVLYVRNSDGPGLEGAADG